ncbi:MAG TPA: DNA-binding domain-containing protein [Steroidobacteraceae bacterium]|jgi:hypothetical protein
MKLSQLQAAFQAHILRGDLGIAEQIEGDVQVAKLLRLGVYTTAYTARLVEVLGVSFPAVQVALGTRRFSEQIGAFVRRHPSRVRSARAYGEALPQWLASALDGPRGRGIADLARFEWAVAGAFDAADQVALAPRSLAGVPPAQWPNLRFAFSPTLRRLSIGSNAVAWWRFAGAEQPRPCRWRETLPQQWLVWRQALAVRYRRLSRIETQALDAALAGGSFGQLCGQIDTPTAAQAAAQAATLLHGWFSEGLIVGAAAPE